MNEPRLLTALSEGKFLLILPDGRAFRSADPAKLAEYLVGHATPAPGLAARIFSRIFSQPARKSSN